MNYVGFVVTIGLLIAGILFNRQDFKELRKELIDVRKEIADLRIAVAQHDMLLKGNHQ